MIENIFIKMSYGRLHGIKRVEGDRIPIVFIHGMLGQAEDWISDFNEFKDHPCYAISLRGRGQSDYPKNEKEFTLEDHVIDIEAFVNEVNLKKFILVSFSQGVIYAIAYALSNKEKILSLVIQEKTLSQRKFGDVWIQRASLRDDYKNKIKVLKGLAESSKELNLLPQCEIFKKTPVLILKAANESMISLEELDKMKYVFKKSKVVIFEKSGHNITLPDYELYIKTMKDFLNDF